MAAFLVNFRKKQVHVIVAIYGKWMTWIQQ